MRKLVLALIASLCAASSTVRAEGPAGFNFFIQATASVSFDGDKLTRSGVEFFYISKDGRFYFQDAAGAANGFGGAVVKNGGEGCAKDRNPRLPPVTHCFAPRFDGSRIVLRINDVHDDDGPGAVDQWDYTVKITGTKCKLTAAKHRYAHYSNMAGRLNSYKVHGYSDLSCKMASGPLGQSSELN